MSRVSSLGVEGSRITALETELESARREVAAAKESAAMELVVLRHQLAGVQAALSEAEQVQKSHVFIHVSDLFSSPSGPQSGSHVAADHEDYRGWNSTPRTEDVRVGVQAALSEAERILFFPYIYLILPGGTPKRSQCGC